MKTVKTYQWLILSGYLLAIILSIIVLKSPFETVLLCVFMIERMYSFYQKNREERERDTD